MDGIMAYDETRQDNCAYNDNNRNWELSHITCFPCVTILFLKSSCNDVIDRSHSVLVLQFVTVTFNERDRGTTAVVAFVRAGSVNIHSTPLSLHSR
jgi:hypothetical protein